MATKSTIKKMKVEIWSDVMCSFCYIGKKNFEIALSGFGHASNIEITWKSFQLAPGLKSEPDKNYYQALSDNSGMSIEQSKAACDQLTTAAKEVGLNFNFDKAVPVNTFNAHRFSHLAKKKGLQNEAEEILFKSYFTDGRNIDDIATIVELGTAIGLDISETRRVLETNQFADEVYDDLHTAKQTGVKSVPHYIFNEKHAVSGVQESHLFLQTLQKAYTEWTENNLQKTLEITDGQSCAINGKCE